MASESHPFHPKDTLADTAETAGQLTLVGATLAGVQSALSKQNVGATGIVTRFGGTIALFGGAGGLYMFAKDASANLRQKDDSYNNAIGGFFAGAAAGLPRRSIPVMLGAGAGIAVVMSAANYTGGLMGHGKDPEVDEIDRKEALRRNRRRPIQEVVDELGEGRGIYAPGYLERRRERLKERYGVDVGEPVR